MLVQVILECGRLTLDIANPSTRRKLGCECQQIRAECPHVTPPLPEPPCCLSRDATRFGQLVGHQEQPRKDELGLGLLLPQAPRAQRGNGFSQSADGVFSKARRGQDLCAILIANRCRGSRQLVDDRPGLVHPT
ncbi:MAG TPA: hypothetical protein VKB55_08020 [Nocardioidaceae bacterium]|nr:hypothetical protein [Nocardioidaceae bacterium]